MTNKITKQFLGENHDCEMDFASEDGLEWHKKKHTVSLKLGLSDKSCEGSDQTPTPTRFIRNCEEVGLFQDLQHVNPFDETFRKAIQSKSNGASLQSLTVPESSGDDTLHTPHIFPPVDEITEKHRAARKESIDDISLVIDDNVMPISYENSIEETEHGTTSNNEAKVHRVCQVEKPKTDQSKSTIIRIKQFLKDKTDNKEQKTDKDCLESDEDCVIITRVTEVQENAPDVQKTLSNIKQHSTGKKVSSMHRIRESNRKAQQRARSRKKMLQKRMEFQHKFLQAENTKLKAENRYLRDQLIRLRALVTEQSKPARKSINGIKSEKADVDEVDAASCRVSSHETRILPPTAPSGKVAIPRKPLSGPPLILPKLPNAVFLQIPYLQTPLVLAKAVQNSTNQSLPLQNTPSQNTLVQNAPVQKLVIPKQPKAVPGSSKPKKKRKR